MTNPKTHSENKYVVHSAIEHGRLVEICRSKNIHLVWKISNTIFNKKQEERAHDGRKIVYMKDDLPRRH